jgi:Fe(3+) dicitrate transport protein
MNIQYSCTSSSFADASNTALSKDALSGKIPSYQLIDISSSYKIHQCYQLKLGVNNLMNSNSFLPFAPQNTLGLVLFPSLGRMLYCGVSATF